MATETSPEAPGATVTVRGVATPPMALPETKLTLYVVVHGQEPVLESFQVFVKVCPGVIAVSSGMVTSATYAELLQPTAVEPPLLPGVFEAIVCDVNKVGLASGVTVAVDVWVTDNVGVAEGAEACKVNC